MTDYHWHKAWSMDYRIAQEGFYDSTSRPPPFGHPILKYFSLEAGYVNLNNGSYGCVPNPVTRFCSELTNKVEANPDRYHRFSFKPLLVDARKAIAKLVGADVDECVFVSNATAAVNTVVRNLEWSSDDIIIQTTTSWHSTSRTLHYISDTRPYPTLTTFQLTFPNTHAAILKSFRAFIKGLKANMATVDPKKKPKILAVIDSVVANPAAYMPWKEMVAICRDEGVLSLVDAAHSLGQEVNLNLSEIKPDFWITTCHKWLFARRGSAVLYVPFRNQHLIRSSLITSTHYISPKDKLPTPTGSNFVLQHEWPGAIDFVSYLCIPACVEFREWLGGEVAINEYCRGLAIDGGRKLAKLFGTRVMDETPDAQLTLNMTNVELPLPRNVVPEKRTEVNEFLEISLLREYNVFAVTFYHGGAWWVRCSAQIFNDVSDFERLGSALLELCREVKLTFLKDETAQSSNYVSPLEVEMEMESSPKRMASSPLSPSRAAKRSSPQSGGDEGQDS